MGGVLLDLLRDEASNLKAPSAILQIFNCSLVGLVCGEGYQKVIKAMKVSLGSHEEITDWSNQNNL
jgi:hypothetical protein